MIISQDCQHLKIWNQIVPSECDEKGTWIAWNISITIWYVSRGPTCLPHPQANAPQPALSRVLKRTRAAISKTEEPRPFSIFVLDQQMLKSMLKREVCSDKAHQWEESTPYKGSPKRRKGETRISPHTLRTNHYVFTDSSPLDLPCSRKRPSTACTLQIWPGCQSYLSCICVGVSLGGATNAINIMNLCRCWGGIALRIF